MYPLEETLPSVPTPSKMILSLFTLASLAVAASAQSPVWGQCGGIGWNGPITCVSGQGIPGAPAPPTTVSTTGVPSTTVPSTTSNPFPTSTAPSSRNYWFSFGDSYTATGFEINGAAPSPGNPMGNRGNPNYPGSTTTGGENWIDYNTARLNKSLTLTYNFAVSGAVIDNAIVSPVFPGIRSMTDQVNLFLNNLANKPASAPWTSENALFSVWIGINDIGSTYSQGGDRGADVGARNFLFINVPPVNRSPLVSPNSCIMIPKPDAPFEMISNSGASQEATVINGHNSRMATKIASFQASNAGVKTFSYDSYAAFTKILNNPTSYGFKDATSVGNAANNFWGSVKSSSE
ncbi:cellulose-binding gdsl lipase [Moniliophthora roreri]|nr:cellulose-binding gdsl lipase [Moniliophthora roreri]